MLDKDFFGPMFLDLGNSIHFFCPRFICSWFFIGCLYRTFLRHCFDRCFALFDFWNTRWFFVLWSVTEILICVLFFSLLNFVPVRPFLVPVIVYFSNKIRIPILFGVWHEVFPVKVVEIRFRVLFRLVVIIEVYILAKPMLGTLVFSLVCLAFCWDIG